ncbi:MAG: hypothetical protein WAX89_01665 [Alphaproteobacteria bacterium]
MRGLIPLDAQYIPERIAYAPPATSYKSLTVKAAYKVEDGHMWNVIGHFSPAMRTTVLVELAKQDMDGGWVVLVKMTNNPENLAQLFDKKLPCHGLIIGVEGQKAFLAFFPKTISDAAMVSNGIDRNVYHFRLQPAG